MKNVLIRPQQLEMTPEATQAFLFIMKDFCDNKMADKVDQLLSTKDVTKPEHDELVKFVGDELIISINNILDRAIKFKRYSNILKGGQNG